MSVLSQQSFLGQMRVDVPHLRALNFSVCGDFDCLAGQILSGSQPLVVTGFAINMTGAIGAPLNQLQLLVGGSVLMNLNATESGTIFAVPSARAPEVLNPGTNTHIVGSWTASTGGNYVGLDLIRSPDAATSDIVQFLDADTNLEIPETVDTANTLNYRIVISLQPFDSNPNLVPLAIVYSTDGINVTNVIDVRPMLGRLANGGTNYGAIPAYTWPQGRNEATAANVFSGGDKQLSSLKVWMDATMSRIWETGGGEHWYSATADRNVTMVASGTQLASGDYFFWSGTNLTWQGLSFLFDNSTGYYNDVADQTVSSPGLTDLADGECIYVDLGRQANLTGGSKLVAVKAPLISVGTGSPPGSRQVMAWRKGSNVFARGSRFPAGVTGPVATTTSDGIVRLNQTPESSTHPVVVSIMSGGGAAVTATSGNTTAFTGVGSGNRAGFDGTGGATNGVGVVGRGVGTGSGVIGIGDLTPAAGDAIGVLGTAGADNGIGVKGVAVGTGAGVHGVGATGFGIHGVGGTNTSGIDGLGNGTGSGVTGTGGGTAGAVGVTGTGGSAGGDGVHGLGILTGVGVSGTGGATNAAGVSGQGTGSGAGVSGTGGATAGAFGVLGTGGSTNGVGVKGLGIGTGVGGTFTGGTAATATTPANAVTITNGNINMTGVANPLSYKAFANVLTPANIPKAWGDFTFSGSGLTPTTTLTYDTQTANFTVGQVVTGGSSGCTATITADADGGATGTLTISNVKGGAGGISGWFINGETITDPLGGSAKANLVPDVSYEGFNILSVSFPDQNTCRIVLAQALDSSGYPGGKNSVIVTGRGNGYADNTAWHIFKAIVISTTQIDITGIRLANINSGTHALTSALAKIDFDSTVADELDFHMVVYGTQT